MLERSLILVQKLPRLLITTPFDSRGVAQPGSATVLGTVGREFESRRPDHTVNDSDWVHLQSIAKGCGKNQGYFHKMVSLYRCFVAL